jgi:tape measure domain-containing protein
MASLGGNDVTVIVGTEADTSELDRAKDKVAGFSTAAVSASQKLAIGIAGAGVGVGAFGIGAVKLAADMEQSKVAFKTLLGSAEKADEFLNKLKKDAAATPFELKGLVDMSQRLIGSGINAEKARETVLRLGDALSATGAGGAEMERIGATISQVFGKGKADAVDFKEMVNAGWVSVKQDTADAMGLTMKQFEDAVGAGKIGFEELSSTLGKVTGEGGKYFGAMADQSKTVSGTFSTLKDTVSMVMVDIGNKIITAFNLSGPEGNIAKLTETVQRFGDYFIGTVIPFLEKNKGVFVAIGLTVATLLAPAFFAWAIAAGAAAISLLAVTWPILALIALGTALYLAWNNNFMGIKDLAIGLKDTIVGVVNSVIDKVRSMVNSVKNFINDLISKANSVGKIIPGFKEIPQFANGVTNFSGGVALVGEKGPELVNLPRGSNVIPNNQIGSGGATVYQTNNIYGDMDMEQSLRDLVFAVQTA